MMIAYQICYIFTLRFGFMLVLTCSFIAESVVNIVSITNEEVFRANFTLIQSLYLTLNLVSIAAILVLFAKLVSAAEEAYRTSQESVSVGSYSVTSPVSLLESIPRVLSLFSPAPEFISRVYAVILVLFAKLVSAVDECWPCECRELFHIFLTSPFLQFTCP